MTELKLNSSTIEFILSKMESLTKSIIESNVWESEIIAKKIGEFSAFKELLDNSGYESYGLKFTVKIPTKKEYGEKIQ